MSHKFTTISEGVEWCSRCGMAKVGDVYHMVGLKLEADDHRKTACWRSPDATLQALFKWIDVREKVGHGYPRSASGLQCDLDHSALFQRLLADEPILPEPPPRAYSSPWYSLLDKGEAHPHEVWFAKDKGVTIWGPNTVIIEQSSAWRVLETISEEEDLEEWIVSYEVPDVELAARLAREAHSSVNDWVDAQKKSTKGKTTWIFPSKLSETRWRLKHDGSRVYFHDGKMHRHISNSGEPYKFWSLVRVRELEMLPAPPQSPSSATQ